MTKLGILDIGTNSIHMVLAEVEPDFSYKILDRFKDMTRLGDGAFTTHRLTEAAMTRALEVIRKFTALARIKGYERIEAVATSAVREATNGGEFIEAVGRETGLRVRVVTGQEEARLIYLGVRHSMDLSDRNTLIVDVGGGSVELILGNGKRMLRGQSLKLGAIRLKDLYLKHDPPTQAMLRKMQKAVDAELKAALEELKTDEFDRIVATSGMAGNLTEVVHLRRTGRPIPQLNLATASLKEIEAVEDLLTHASFKARLAIPGLDARRADTLLPATTVLRVLLERTGHRDVTISDKAIREGLIYDFIERHRERLRTDQEIPNVRRRAVIHLARRCRYPETHSHHVARLALRLFDQTRPLHRLAEREREWLEYAALLHDIGYLINSRQHHKHAYYLITKSDLSGFTAYEIQMIANIARYHRGALPQTDHQALGTLGRSERKTIKALSALLRIADGLDRSHFSVIQDIEVTLGKPVRLILRTAGDPELEIWAASGRTDLFEKTFKRSVHFDAAAPKRGVA
jgi:exopolyphosphatase/guanosine-5'-triphosphate,3'-diphosphate pyrophosphatase